MAMYLEKCFCIHCRYGIEVCFGAFVLQYVAVCCSACSAYLHDDAAITVHFAHAHRYTMVDLRNRVLFW